MNKGKLVLLSGGLDSTVLLAEVRNTYPDHKIAALSLSYGQRHSKEIAYAEYQANKYNAEFFQEDLSEVFQYNPSYSSLLGNSDKDVEHGAYGEQINKAAGAPVGAYVPFRNGLFLSYAASVALQLNCNAIFYGAHSDDAAGFAYPDCSEAFIQPMSDAIFYGTGREVFLEAPFAKWTKTQIVALGKSLDVEFDKTWSCYEGGKTPCGICGTCIDRRKAMDANGITEIFD